MEMGPTRAAEDWDLPVGEGDGPVHGPAIPVVVNDGSLSGGSGSREYEFFVEDHDQSLTDLYFATDSGLPSRYSNMLMPPGWAMYVGDEPLGEPFPIDHALAKTEHGGISPGPSGHNFPYVVHFTDEGPGGGLPGGESRFGFDFNLDWPPHDVGWRAFDSSGATAGAWDEPVGLGAGPVHTPYDPPSVGCDGLESGGPGNVSCDGLPRFYSYPVVDPDGELTDILVGTGSSDTAAYTNVCMPPGWSFTIEPNTHGVGGGQSKTLHGGIAAAPTDDAPYVLRFSGPAGLPVGAFDFGFDHPLPSMDYGWRGVATGQTYGCAWTEPVGAGNGPVHAPICDVVPEGPDLEGEPICFDGYVDSINAGCDGLDFGHMINYSSLTFSYEVPTTITGNTGSHLTPAVTVPCSTDDDCDPGDCGNLVPGTCDEPQGVADTDWYWIIVDDTDGNGDQVTWSVEGDYPAQATIIHDASFICEQPTIEALDTSGSCSPAVASACLPQGDYFVRATYDPTLAINSDLGCGRLYNATLLVQGLCFVDCNGNGIRDDIDIVNCDPQYPGGENCCLDCDDDGVPNDCELDGNDLDGNCIPDDQEDCGGFPCDEARDCVDLNADDIMDDSCIWGECIAPLCNVVTKDLPADLGGPFGACPIEGFCNIHDRNHALTCFAGTNPCPSINLDAGGPFGSCQLDGFCNIHDANHALTCFSGSNPCTCGPQPDGPIAVVGESRIVARPRDAGIRAGDNIAIDVFLADAQSSLQSYQLHVEASGGDQGTTRLEDIRVEKRKDFVFAETAGRFDAVNVTKGQMLSGLNDGGVATRPLAYLATYVYRATPDARGMFVVDVRHDEASLHQTFLVSDFRSKIDVTSTTPAVIEVEPRSRVVRSERSRAR